MAARAVVSWVAVVLTALAGCSSSGAGGGAAAGGGGAGRGGGGGESGGAGTGGAGGEGAGGGARFTYGLNLGYYNPQLSDREASQLGLAAGARSHRHKLTEPFLDRWGDDIHVEELRDMLASGEQELVCFLIGAAEGHSTAPAGSADWEREHYAPKNLYEPIFTETGAVNPNNYWAAFVERVVRTYGPYIHTWEVWNEPDQVHGNWQAAQTWRTQPPQPTDLVWWNDTLYAYIRLLRITHEVVRRLDPQGKVALGGIGHPSFLAALLRYTDEPTSGKLDAEHPRQGDAYFDVVSYHYYPIFSSGNSDEGARGLVSLGQELRAELDAAGVTGKSFIVTESGAPRFAVGGRPGGPRYAVHYLMKAMSLAQHAGVRRVDWFILGDAAEPGASTDAFDYMGLYGNLTSVSSPTEAQLTDTGVAYATLSGLLTGATTLATGTSTSPGAPQVVALRTREGRPAYVTWMDAASGEDARGVVELPSSGEGSLYAWDYSRTGQVTRLAPTAGQLRVELTSAPLIVLTP